MPVSAEPASTPIMSQQTVAFVATAPTGGSNGSRLVEDLQGSTRNDAGRSTNDGNRTNNVGHGSSSTQYEIHPPTEKTQENPMSQVMVQPTDTAEHAQVGEVETSQENFELQAEIIKLRKANDRLEHQRQHDREQLDKIQFSQQPSRETEEGGRSSRLRRGGQTRDDSAKQWKDEAKSWKNSAQNWESDYNCLIEDSTKRITALEQEVLVLKHRASSADADARTYEARYKQASDQSAEKDKFIRRLQKEAENLRRSLDVTDRRRVDVELRLGSAGKEIDSLTRDVSESHQQLATAFSQSASTAQKLNDANREISRLTTKLTNTEALLDSRTSELRTAESFLTKYDNIAGDDVVHMVSDVNMQMLHIASTVSESVSFESKPGAVAALDVDQLDRVSAVLGPDLYSHLKRHNFGQDPTLVQLAIQTSLAEVVDSFLGLWPIHPDGGLSPIWSLFQHVQANEQQAIASRWRALGTKHVRSAYSHDYVRLFEMMKARAVEIIVMIVLLAGAPAKPPDAYEFVNQRIGAEVDRLLATVEDMAQKVKEQVSSTDYQLFRIPPQEDFDDKRMRPQGSTQPSSKSTGRRSGKDSRVLCTVELGLRRRTNPTKPGEASNGALEEVVMERAVVIFEHEAKALLPE